MNVSVDKMPHLNTPTAFNEEPRADDFDATPIVTSNVNGYDIFQKFGTLHDSNFDGTGSSQPSLDNFQGHSLIGQVTPTPQQPLDGSFLFGLNPELYQSIGQNFGKAYCPSLSTGSNYPMVQNQSFGIGGQKFHPRITDSFIPGAISNCTLEHLTESSLRTNRVVHADQKPYGYSGPGNGFGIIGDRGGVAHHGSGMSGLNLFGFTRSTSPSDSETSGFSSGGSEFSETALLELMNTLQRGQSNPLLSSCLNTNGFVSRVHQSHSSPSLPSIEPPGACSPPIDLLKILGLSTDIPLQRQPMSSDSQFQQPLYNDFSMSADLFASRPCNALNTLFATSSSDPHSIERAAKLYRNAATISEPTCTWSGQLPFKNHRNPIYSCKVFLGGVPWDITEAGLQSSFRSFGPLKIEWPGKDGKHPRYPTKGKELPAGYVYIHFESERSVKSLLQACTHDFTNGGEYYYKISSRRMRSKEVQVIPWVVSDSNYAKQPSQRLDPQKTVFVGALHGMLTAEGLAHILNDLFGNVVYAGIDTDKHKYPIGSGRVTFCSHKSYVKAVTAAFVEIKTSKFTKKIQIDPYLEESPCNLCGREQGPYFCRDFHCFRYYCRTCWQLYHSTEAMKFHKPLMRNNKSNGIGSIVLPPGAIASPPNV